jgi:hypothetical protein
MALFDRVDHRLRPIVEVWAVVAKLLEQRDHFGDLLLAQDRQFQIEQLAALGKAIVASLRGENQYDQIEGRGSSAR